MKLYNYIALLFFVSLCGQTGIAQSLSPYVLGGGGFKSTTSGSMSWSIGEPVISTGVEANFTGFATEGFQQPTGCLVIPITAYNTVLCQGARIKLSTYTGLTGYQWYRNDTVIASVNEAVYLASSDGTYTVRAKLDSTCAIGAPITLTKNSALTAPTIPVIASTSDTVCEGKTITISTTATGISAFQWGYDAGELIGATASTITPLYSGNYFVNVTTPNGCTNVSDSITVSLNAAVKNPTISVADNQGYLKATNILSTTVTYQWYVENRLIVNYTTDSMPLLYNGTYKIGVTYPSGCQMFSASYTKTGLSQNILRVALLVTDSTITLPGADVASFTVYPNPNDGTFAIDYTSSASASVTIKLYNLTGTLANSWDFENTTGKLYETITTQNLAAGMYILTLSDGSNSYTSKLIIK